MKWISFKNYNSPLEMWTKQPCHISKYIAKENKNMCSGVALFISVSNLGKSPTVLS